MTAIGSLTSPSLSSDLAPANQSKKINPKTPKIPQAQIVGVTTGGIRFSIWSHPTQSKTCTLKHRVKVFSTKAPNLYPLEEVTTVSICIELLIACQIVINLVTASLPRLLSIGIGPTFQYAPTQQLVCLSVTEYNILYNSFQKTKKSMIYTAA